LAQFTTKFIWVVVLIAAELPVTVMVYVPRGVTEPPVGAEIVPPHASIWVSSNTVTTPRLTTPRRRRGRKQSPRLREKQVANASKAGSHGLSPLCAHKSPPPLLETKVADDEPAVVMVTVAVELLAALIASMDGEILQPAPSGSAPHDNETA
jgi:hypothetical protein